MLSDSFVVVGGISRANGTVVSVKRGLIFFPSNQTWGELTLDPSFPDSWSSVVTASTSTMLLTTNLASTFVLASGTTTLLQKSFSGAPNVAVVDACGDSFPDRGTVLVYGGSAASQCQNILWEINLPNATMEIVPALNGPPALFRSSAVQSNDTLYVFGGYSCQTTSSLNPMLNYVWSFSYSTMSWSQLTTNMPNVNVNKPVFLPSTNTIVLYDYFGSWYSFDTTAGENNQFSKIQLNSSDTNPGPRYAAALFPQGEFVYVFGGSFQSRSFPNEQENAITYGDMNLMKIVADPNNSGTITLPVWLFGISVAAGPILALLVAIMILLCKSRAKAQRRKARKKKRRLMRRQQEEDEED